MEWQRQFRPLEFRRLVHIDLRNATLLLPAIEKIDCNGLGRRCLASPTVEGGGLARDTTSANRGGKDSLGALAARASPPGITDILPAPYPPGRLCRATRDDEGFGAQPVRLEDRGDQCRGAGAYRCRRSARRPLAQWA